MRHPPLHCPLPIARIRPGPQRSIGFPLQRHPLSSGSSPPPFASPSPPTSTSPSPAPTLPFLHKHTLVSGSSRGIGLSTAIAFAQLGSSVILTGRHAPSLSAALSSLPSVHASQTHATAAGSVARRGFWEEVVKEHGAVDILINAAGVARSKLLLRMEELEVEEILQTNLQGTLWGCQVVRKQMVRRGGGCIINISSLLGVKGGRGTAVYAASKAGVIGLTRALAAELGPSGVRVNAILPGYIETQMTDGMPAKTRSQILDSIPISRFGHPDEIADAAAFLVKNQYANNCVLNLDGGLSAV